MSPAGGASRTLPDDAGGAGVGGGDLDDLPAWERGRARVGRLTAAAGIETGPVERDRPVAHRDDARLGLEAMVVVEVEPDGGRDRHEMTREQQTARGPARPAPC